MNLNQITVPSIDVARAVAFYQKLGLFLIVDSIPRYARLLCPDGESSFSIHQVTELPSGTGVSVYFECKDIDATVAELKAKGMMFDTEIIDQVWLWREAYLKDPDGNQLILFFAGDNRKNPPWRLK